MEGGVVEDNGQSGVQLGQEDMLDPGVEDVGVSVAFKAHRSLEDSLVQCGDEADPGVRFGAANGKLDFLPLHGSGVRAVVLKLNAAFVEVEELFAGDVTEFLQKLPACLRVSFSGV